MMRCHGRSSESAAWAIAWAGWVSVACAGPTIAAKRTALGPDDGERRVIFAQGRQTPITIKVDPVTMGSRHFVMGTADIRQGSRVPVHRHDEDELIFVYKGNPTITLGDETFRAEPGTTVFIPQGTWIGLENGAPEPVTFVWVFTHQQFEKWVRAIAVREGEPLVEKLPAEVKEINRKYNMDFR